MSIDFKNVNFSVDKELIAEAEKNSYFSTNNIEISGELLKKRIENVKAYSDNEDWLAKIIVYNNENAGFLFFGINNSDYGFIYTIYVRKDYRRKGIAKKAIERCIELARLNDVKKVFLNVGSKNYPALSCYENYGFVETEKTMKLDLE